MPSNPLEEGLTRGILWLQLFFLTDWTHTLSTDMTSLQLPAETDALAGMKWVKGGAGHDVSLLLTATGGALGLPTLLGRKLWLWAWLLQAGSGIVLTLGIVTVPTSDRLVLIWSNVAIVGCIHAAAIKRLSHCLLLFSPCKTIFMMYIKVKVKTTPFTQTSRCMSYCRCTTGCQCGDVLIKASEHMLNTLYQIFFLPLPSPPCVIHSFISHPCSPGLVCEWAAQAGCQGGWASMALGSDWSRSPSGRLPSSLLPVKPQPPERQTHDESCENKKDNKLKTQHHNTTTYEMLWYAVLLHPTPTVITYPILDLKFWDKLAAGNRNDEKTQQTNCTDETGVIILNLDNRQSCHVIPMQLHCMTQQLLEESNSTGMTVLWHKSRLLHMEEKCRWILIVNEIKDSSWMTEQMNKQACWMKEQIMCLFIYSFLQLPIHLYI